jgi:hypothetical protein
MKRRSLVLIAAVAGSVAFSVAPALASSTPVWSIAKTDSAGTALNDVTATGPSDAWAVGADYINSSGLISPVVTWWNGHSWKAITLPAGIRKQSEAYATGVAATSAKDAWVEVTVVPLTAGAGQLHYLLHWDGSAWNREVTSTYAVSLVAVNSKDYWGFYLGESWHFNGTTWTESAMPDVVVSAVATGGSVWALGSSASGMQIRHLVAGKWQAAKLPDIKLPTGESLGPESITADNAKDVWADAVIGNGASGAVYGVVLLHYNGQAWTRVSIPYTMHPLGDALLAPDGSGGVWLVVQPTNQKQYVYHDHSGHWTSILTPAAKDAVSYLSSLAWIPGGTSAWGVGSENVGPSTTYGIILKYGP